MLIVNAKIYTMEDTLIENGYILINDGKIKDIGQMSELICQKGDGAEVIDLDGAMVFPGFIDAHCHVGMWEDSTGFEGDDGNEDTDPCTPQLRAIDAVNPLDICFKEALYAGITTVATGPGSSNAIAGQFAALKTCGKRIEDMLIKEPLAIKFALGENPKTVYHGKNQTPSTRMATAAIIREQLYKAKRYLEDCDSKVEDEDRPEFDFKCEALRPLLCREIPAHFHAHRADDIFTAIRIAKEFNIRFVLVHGTEGHLIADLLAKENSQILCGPIICDRSKPELKNLTPSGVGILSRAGVLTAITTDHPCVPIQYLTLCAGLAVANGMKWYDAMKSITINPAKILGIDSRVGSLAPGKDADIVVFDDDPLQLSSKPKMVILNGKVVKEE